MNASTLKISTHILDTNKGLPVSNVSVKLYKLKNNEWIFVNEGKTEAKGRIADLIDGKIEDVTGTYKLNYETKQYYDSINVKTMYPFIDITFEVDKEEHYHLPLLLNAYGYSTYRGS